MVPVAKAVEAADAVFVGSVVSVTPMNPDGSSANGDYKSIVKGTRLFWGAMNVANAGNVVFFTLHNGETLPQIGHSYIICFTGNAQKGVWDYVSIKMFPGTDMNIRAIKHLLRNKPRTY